MNGDAGPEKKRLDPEFTIAQGLSESVLLPVLRDWFTDRPESELEVDRSRLDDVLEDVGGLSKSDAETLFTGLVLNDVARQTSAGRTFAEYTFTVECESAARVLESQRIARAALEEVGLLNNPKHPRVELTATFPTAIDSEDIDGIRPLSSDLRKMFFDADSVVRIANPYFDPGPSVVGDIASLADRGVTTKILTRETASASSDLVSTLNSIHEEIDPSNRHRLRVRDLYRRDAETGRQAYATHAKIAIADSEICYLGSANLTDTSLSNNFELGVLLRGETVDTTITVFETVFEFAREVDLPL